MESQHLYKWEQNIECSEGSGQMSITKQITVLKGKVRCYYND